MRIFTLLVAASFASLANATFVNNGSFETGDFSGWTTQDLSVPFYPLSVAGSGETPGFGFFSSSPTDGGFAALNGFDGNGPGTIRISQDITVTSVSTLRFDYRAAWDLIGFCSFDCLDRTFQVNIEQAGGGSNLASYNVLTALGETTVFDTGNLLRSIDLSGFIGQTVSLNFDWFIPENFTGPAFFQIDNIRFSVPEPSILTLFGIGLAGIAFSRKRKAN